MRYSGSVADVLKAFTTLRRSIFPAVLVLVLAGMTLGEPPAQGGESVKQLIRQAARLARSGDLAKAETLLRRARVLDQDNSTVKVELAYVLTKQRKILEAYELSLGVAEAEKTNARAHAVLGATLLSGGRFPEARLVLLNAIRLNRREDLAWAGLGMLEFYENRVATSLDHLEQAAYYKPREPDYQFAYAQVAARYEQYGAAAEAYNRFLEVSDINDKDRRDRIKGLINFLRFLGQVGHLYQNAGGRETTMPFELVGDRPVITLRINDKDDPLRFVLDTGSGISVISEETAKRLKIKPITRGGFGRGLGGDGKFEIVYGFLREVDIGEVTLKNVPIYIRKFHSGGANVDGYIGLSLISKFLTTVDYGARTFSLIKKEGEGPKYVENTTDPSLPLRLTSSGFLSGEVKLEGLDVPLNFIVDTGASVSVISESVARTDGITPFAHTETMRVIGSAGITNDVPTFLLPRVTFGSHSREDIKAVALDLDVINEASGFEQAGILGGNFLKNYRLTFDFKNSKVIFVAVDQESKRP